MPHSRRSFLATLGAAAFGAARAAHAGTARRTQRAFGVQLYTLRAGMRSDVDAVLERVAAIGLREVEFAGYFDLSPDRIATLLRRHSLVAPSAHVGLDEIERDGDRVLDVAARAGHRWVTVPWLAAGERRTLDDWKRVADRFGRAAEHARGAGLRFAYHNHDFEFTRVEDVVPLELLIERTTPGMVDFQLDVYWATRAGFDPIDLLQRYRGRFAMTHLKDSAGAPEHRMVDVGAGTIDFGAILAAADAAGVQHHFIEHDQPADAFATVAAGYRHLAALRS